MIQIAINQKRLYTERWEWYPLILIFSHLRRSKSFVDKSQEQLKAKDASGVQSSVFQSELERGRKMMLDDADEDVHSIYKQMKFKRFQKLHHTDITAGNEIGGFGGREGFHLAAKEAQDENQHGPDEYSISTGTVLNPDWNNFAMAGFHSSGDMQAFGGYNFTKGYFDEQDAKRVFKKKRMKELIRKHHGEVEDMDQEHKDVFMKYFV
mmetsp:Transcript_14303/g.25728  ORF Transcript_14303/g.25728 Transcript_14303/m.25728 type:complete len:208 (-) Transcript_14303:280-903(-)